MQKEIRLYHIDTLEYQGSIQVNGTKWEYRDIDYPHLEQMTRGMPLRAVLANLAYFDLLYEIEE